MCKILYFNDFKNKKSAGTNLQTEAHAIQAMKKMLLIYVFRRASIPLLTVIV